MVQKLEYYSKKVLLDLWKLLKFIFLLMFELTVLVGAISAAVVAFKLYPEIAIIYLKPIISVFGFLLKLITPILVFGLIAALIFTGVQVYIILDEVMKRLKKKNDIRREKFLDDLTKKLQGKVMVSRRFIGRKKNGK